jgi:predicted nucleic acid-binding protein
LTTLVLDASVAVKWAIPFVGEPLSDEALALLKRHSDGEFDFIVPDIFWAEVGNVLCRGSQRKRWSRIDAEQALSAMQARDFVTVGTYALVQEALRIAFTHEQAVYDCLYVALAKESEANLITADERLANALAARFPVKWLGAF